MRVRWLCKAIRNLDAEADHIALDDPQAAAVMYAYIKARANALADFPASGRPGRVMGTRELVIEKYPYFVPYRVVEEEIQILRVFHTSRKLPERW